MTDGEGNFRSEGPDRGPMDQFSAHLDRGWDLVNRGEFGAAQRSAEKSLELDAESPEAHNLLGYVHAAQGDHHNALHHYRQAIALDDSFVEAMLNAAEVLIHPLHDFDAALSLVDDALEWAEGDDEVADALLLKFDACIHRGDHEAARKVLKTLPAEQYDSPRLDFLVGRAHFEVGQLERAEALLKRAVERDPDSADAHYFLGLTFEAADNQMGATVEFLRARELDMLLPRAFWALPAVEIERTLQGAIAQLSSDLRAVLDGTLIVVCDAPGAEIVVDGVDPRVALLLDTPSEAGGTPRAARMFVYQRNVERIVDGPEELEQTLLELIEAEIRNLFPTAAPPPQQEPTQH